jgi:phosphoribosyl 1,2-cyclic phosphodiesterase
MSNVEVPRFRVRFWGVRGSYPTPGSHTVRYGGNTACVEVQVGRQTLIFDAGSGIIGLGTALTKRIDAQADAQKELDLALFITHGHNDHLVGFPFFAPLFDARTNLHLFGPQLADQNIEELITPMMSPPYFPVDVRTLPSKRSFCTIADGYCISWLPDDRKPKVLLPADYLSDPQKGEVRVFTRFTQQHPLNGSIVYRVEYGGRSVVYATDVEWEDGCEQSFLDFVSGADVLIHDAQYTTWDYHHLKRGFGHSTVAMAIDAAKAAHVKELILFHHEPTYDDEQLDTMEAEARTYFAHTRSARESMEIDLLA